MRRFRVTFSKGEAVRYISHLDLMRTWERILRRAAIKLAHSQGFNPRPRLVFAAPLPVGVTSDAEVVDVVVEDELSADELASRVRRALPPGIKVVSAVEVPLDLPPLMAGVLWSDYVVRLEQSSGDLEEPIRRFLASTSVPYERTRKGVSKQAEMRPAVLELAPTADGLRMRLRLDVEGLAVRPEEVVAALDPNWRVRRVHRVGLGFKDAAAGARHAA